MNVHDKLERNVRPYAQNRGEYIAIEMYYDHLALVDTADLKTVLVQSASCILTQTPPFGYMVTSDFTQTFSTVLLP